MTTEFNQQCNYFSEYNRLDRKTGKKIKVKRSCQETVTIRNGLGGYLVGTCPRGHVNGEKASADKFRNVKKQDDWNIH